MLIIKNCMSGHMGNWENNSAEKKEVKIWKL